MRSVIALTFLVITGCGSDGGGGGSNATASAPTFESFVAYSGPCNWTTKTCPLMASGKLAGTPDTATWGMALTVDQGTSAPECTVTNAYDFSGGFFQLPLEVEGGSVWAFRACVWNKVTGAFPESKNVPVFTIRPL